MNCEKVCDILVVGGGTGGVAAAIAAAKTGVTVILTEEFPWLGGQLTSQLVPPDEHPWIESQGCTASYREFRDRVREFYRRNRPLTSEARSRRNLNPGSGWVSRLCFQPRIGDIVLREMLDGAGWRGNLEILEGFRPRAVEIGRDEIISVAVVDQGGNQVVISPKMVIDATETGDLLPMAGAEYVVGAESRTDTQEPHALNGDAEPENVQGITWCAVFALDEGSHRTIDKPADYDFWRNLKPTNWPGKIFDFTIENPVTGAKRELPLFSSDPKQWYALFSYRQIVDPSLFEGDPRPHPATVVNWPMNDYYLGSILDVPEETRETRLGDSRRQTMALLYWLQTEAPRHDEGTGYPGLYLRPDLTGTTDGLAQAPYIRESRRIQARTRVVEQMVSAESNKGLDRAPAMARSVGIGAYRIDIHPCANGASTLDLSSLPFQIPLGALLPVRMRNLIAGAKNIGVTHITNGCYRLHPVEWNIGEAAGLLASVCTQQDLPPEAFDTDGERWSDFESLVRSYGIETMWPSLRPL